MANLITKEIKISVPWGIIAAKTWGDEQNQPVIALHGYQDSASSFDTLIPLLPNTFYYICVDLPSHGQSTHLPTVTCPNTFDFIMSLKLCLDSLNRKKYILLGHSFGAQTEIVFTQMYPEYVIKLIMLDATYYIPMNPGRCFNELKEVFTRYYKSITKIDQNSAPSYTLEDAVERMQEARFSHISKESAKILIQRSLVPITDGKYKFTTAQHLKYNYRPPFTIQYNIELVEHFPVSCPHLIILALDTVIVHTMFKQLLQVFEKNKHFELHKVQGGHDVHLEHPERVAPIISKFLLKQHSHKL